jgi:hypothetical protein
MKRLFTLCDHQYFLSHPLLCTRLFTRSIVTLQSVQVWLCDMIIFVAYYFLQHARWLSVDYAGQRSEGANMTNLQRVRQREQYANRLASEVAFTVRT